MEIFSHYINSSSFGGCGVLATYRQGDSFIRIATAVCSKKDQYNKRIARFLLRENMQTGKVICVPRPGSRNSELPHRDLRNTIDKMFNLELTDW